MDRLAAVSGEGCKAKVLHPAMTWVRVKGHKQFSKVRITHFAGMMGTGMKRNHVRVGVGRVSRRRQMAPYPESQPRILA
jgi:hypothetical protein